MSASALVLTLAACAETTPETATPAAAAEWVTLDEAGYTDQIVGRTIRNETSNFIANPDGSMTGLIGEDEVTGTWAWNAAGDCVDFDLAWADRSTTSCNKPQVLNGQYRSLRPNGDAGPTYTIE